MHQKTKRLHGLTYTSYELIDSPWTILIRKDTSGISVPVYRTGWEDGGEVEIFTLLPPPEISDRELLQVRIYTKAVKNDGKPGVPNPVVSVQCHVPAFTLIEPEHQRVLVSLLCEIEIEGQRLKIIPTFPDPWW
jgi:hypothetical protein